MVAHIISVSDLLDEPLPPLAEFETGWLTTQFLPDSTLTFPARFAKRVASRPNDVAFFEATFDKQEPRATAHTISEIHARALRAAVSLDQAGVRSGDRVLLCLEDTPAFLAFMLAAQGLGAVPVPLPCASEFQAREAFRERIDSVALDCAPRAIVVDAHGAIESVPEGLASQVAVLDAGDLNGADNHIALPASFGFQRSFRETAFIQYTSGSTGSPKGVVVTHYNLVANMRAITEGAGFGPGDRSFNWLPLYHDMGLVGGFLLGIYLGIETFVMPTRSFVRRPDSWLRAMSRFKATFACAPNFAYYIVANRLPESALVGLDLSHWRLAFNGAEPIDRTTVEEFAHRLGGSGVRPHTMYPVYGMAECTLAAAFPKPGAVPRYDFVNRDVLTRDGRAVEVAETSPTALCFVSVGRAVPGQRIRVLAPDGTAELAERHVGEIVVSGPSVTSHYFRRDGQYPPPHRELRTGDLGYVADGELYVVDRIKDLVIVGGRNIVPSDIERLVAHLPGVRSGAVVAFAIRGSEGTDELHLVVGVEQRVMHDEALRKSVKETVYRHFGLAPRAVVFVKPAVIPRTSSGKVRRRACRELYELGEFAPASAADLKAC